MTEAPFFAMLPKPGEKKMPARAGARARRLSIAVVAMVLPPSSASLTLYTHVLCPYAQRVALVLEAKGLDYDAVEIDLAAKPRWYTDEVGNLVPALRLEDGRVYTESLDICHLLETRFPEPSLSAADVNDLIRFCPKLEQAGWAALGGAWVWRGRGSGNPQPLRRAVAELEKRLEASGGPFLCGDRLTLADCILAPFAMRFSLLVPAVRGWDPVGEGAVARWAAVLTATDAWRRTFPADVDAFRDAAVRHGALDFFDRESNVGWRVQSRTAASE